jgi:tRNA threonylcarbamoyladenosine biosynthesis protein TsaE
VTELATRNPEETEAAGERLGRQLRSGDVVYLIGDLGSGKTCFARGLALGVGAPASEVASPTFALIHEYAGGGGETILRHLDLYRLPDRARDLESIGVPDTLAGAPVAVEWPGEAIRTLLPPTVEVTIVRAAGDGDGERKIRIDRM